MDLVKVRVIPKGNILEYVKLIRDFDNSIPLGEIKRRLENNEPVIEFDLDSYDPLEEILVGTTSYDYEMNLYGLLEKIESMGADVELTHYEMPISMQFLFNWIQTREETRQEIDEISD